MVLMTVGFIFNHLVWSKPTAEWPQFSVATVQVFPYKTALLNPLLLHVYELRWSSEPGTPRCQVDQAG